MKKILKLFTIATMVLLAATSCKKNNLVVDKDASELNTPTYAEFLLTNFVQNYYVKGTADSIIPFSIPVGVTTPSGVDKDIKFTYTSPTGATAAQYVGAGTLTFKANTVTDNLKMLASYHEYDLGRIDTVKVKMTGGSLTPFVGKDSVIVVIQKYCEVVLADLLGDYTNTNEYNAAGTQTYGPYTVSVSNLVATSATTATGSFVNLYDDGWNDINFTMDWTNPSNFKITIPIQATGKGYGGATSTSVRTSTTKASTFSSCNGTFNLVVDLVNDGTGAVSTANYQFILMR